MIKKRDGRVKKIVGKRIKAAREKKGMGQGTLSDKLEMNPCVMYHYEMGKIAPSVEVVVKLSKILGVSADYLLGIKARMK